MTKNPLDTDLQRISGIDAVTRELSRKFAAPALAVAFLLSMAVWAAFSTALQAPLIEIPIAAAMAGYMAINIGANDVANNMGPVVGARALSMAGALAVAAVFEASGALLAGEKVVQTIARDLLASAPVDSADFIRAMLAALLAGAAWVNLATYIRAPVSTTHAIVGGVVGAGIAAGGLGLVSWPVIATIAVTWIVSPIMGGCFAALFLYISRRTVTERLDKLAAARVWVPIFVAAMTGTFALYFVTEAIGGQWPAPFWLIVCIGPASALVGWVVAMPWIRSQSLRLENRKKQVATLFRLPLIVSAAFFSFGHGANDVANAVGPLAAIVATLGRESASELGPLPFWVLAIGAFGIALGLALFGPRLVRTVGDQITRLNEIRASCAALASAITVLLASALGLPVSSTHVAVGALFGLGFLREALSRRDMRWSAVPQNSRYVDPSRLNDTPEAALAGARELDRRRLVRRRHVYSILAAWVVTLPAAAILGALAFFALSLVRF
jgi:Phosphate/sulphate permeases